MTMLKGVSLHLKVQTHAEVTSQISLTKVVVRGWKCFSFKVQTREATCQGHLTDLPNKSCRDSMAILMSSSQFPMEGTNWKSHIPRSLAAPSHTQLKINAQKNSFGLASASNKQREDWGTASVAVWISCKKLVQPFSLFWTFNTVRHQKYSQV